MTKISAFFYSVFTKKKKTVETDFFSEALIAAVHSDRNNEIEDLLEKTTQQDHDKAIVQAVESRNPQAAGLLLPFASDEACLKAFFFAAEEGEAGLVQLLLAKQFAQDDINESFHRACVTNELSVAQVLLLHCDHITIESAFDSLCDLIRYGSQWVDLASLLLSKMSDDVLNEKMTRACTRGDVFTFKLILNHVQKISLNVFWGACEKGRSEIVRMLIPRVEPDACGFHAIRVAVENGHVNVVEQLIPFLNLKSDYIVSLLTCAFEKENSRIVKQLIKYKGDKGIPVEYYLRSIIAMDIEMVRAYWPHLVKRDELIDFVSQNCDQTIKENLDYLIDQIEFEELSSSTVDVAKIKAPRRL
ncbi:ankyrin repeat domain-containing protein [Xanthomonas cannabis]|uniref:ankyrin repeat domain-containing protein n=1 Tax=Xanthomonas cannabis TaxID=1885674 RepID=UPI001112C46B|nr:ankyrin repeat domain-containing protein [Xanthomonas cannabis]